MIKFNKHTIKQNTNTKYIALPIKAWCSTLGALKPDWPYCPGISIRDVAGSKSFSQVENSFKGICVCCVELRGEVWCVM